MHVQLGHAPGPLHQQDNFNHYQRTRNGPSRLRRRARRAAERQEKAEEVKESETATDAEKAPNDITEKQNVVEEAAFEDNSVAVAATEEIEINDEFCPNEEYLIDDLNDCDFSLCGK